MTITQQTYRVTDDPMTGVTAETPMGEMWFESTSNAEEELAVFFPDVEFKWERVSYQ